MKLLIFSDIHGDQTALSKLMNIDADYYFAAGDLANWGRGLDQLAPILARRRERTYLMPGNHESAGDIARFAAEHGFQDFHRRSIEIGGYHVAGLGYSNPTPFNTPGEYTEEELAGHLEQFAALEPMVLICHTPPLDSQLDRAGEGRHFGSRAVREFIERRQPAYFYCGHIHEAAGQHEVIGRTQAWNVGKQGRVLELA